MQALAYLLNFAVLLLLAFALMFFGVTWAGVFVCLIVYLLSSWLISSLLQKKCPYCDSAISSKAMKCPKCQSELSEASTSA